MISDNIVDKDIKDENPIVIDVEEGNVVTLDQLLEEKEEVVEEEEDVEETKKTKNYSIFSSIVIFFRKILNV